MNVFVGPGSYLIVQKGCSTLLPKESLCNFTLYNSRTSISAILSLLSKSVVPNLSLAMYPFSISTNEHVPLKILSMA